MKCFLAAHGTGKTTLANAVKSVRKDIYVTDGFNRAIKNADQKLSALRDEKRFTGLQVQYLNFELMRWAQKNYYGQNVLTTRTLFDSLIFNKLLTPDLSIEEIEDEVVENIDKIEAVFYLPIEFELKEDGVRFGRDLQIAYDKEIHHLLTDYQLYSKTFVIRGREEERLEQILALL